MLPKVIKLFFQEPYVCIEGEKTTTGNLSISQLNTKFRETIQFLKKESEVCPTAKVKNYYVVLGCGCEQISLVQGETFINFSVDIPSLPHLKIKVRVGGVSIFDKVASAVELENLFERELLKSERRLRWYVQYLERIRQPMSVSNKMLLELFNVLEAKKSTHKQLLQSAITEGEAQSLRSSIDKLDRGLKFLAKVLVAKGSP